MQQFYGLVLCQMATFSDAAVQVPWVRASAMLSDWPALRPTWQHATTSLTPHPLSTTTRAIRWDYCLLICLWQLGSQHLPEHPCQAGQTPPAYTAVNDSNSIGKLDGTCILQRCDLLRCQDLLPWHQGWALEFSLQTPCSMGSFPDASSSMCHRPGLTARTAVQILHHGRRLQHGGRDQ